MICVRNHQSQNSVQLANMSQNEKPNIIEEWCKRGGAVGHAMSVVETKIMKALADKTSPLHKPLLELGQDQKKAAKKIKRIDLELWESLNLISIMISGRQAMEDSNQEAEKLLEMAKSSTIEEFANLPPISGLTLLCIIAKSDEQMRQHAQEIINNRQSKIAKNKRPARRHSKKLEVLSYLKDWRAKPSNYPTQAAFIRDMQEKMEIDRGETIRQWIKEDESTHSPNRLTEHS